MSFTHFVFELTQQTKNNVEQKIKMEELTGSAFSNSYSTVACTGDPALCQKKVSAKILHEIHCNLT